VQQRARPLTINLLSRIAENVDRFTGRAWLLPEVLTWFEEAPDQRLFLITGSLDVEAFSRELRKVRYRGALSSIREVCDRLERQTGRYVWREMGQALSAIEHSDSLAGRNGWLDALVVAARMGRAEVGAVVRLHSLVSWVRLAAAD